MGQLSEDGMWEWDGAAWQPSAQQIALASPSAAPTRRAPEGKLSRQQARAAAAAQKAQAKDAQRQAAERRAYEASPPGQARAAFARGDQVFQCAFDVMKQEAIVVAMVGSTTSKKTSDPSEILNLVCAEGWNLITGSFVFVEQGQQSRDKFMSSGQNVAIKGMTMGYYLFRRCPDNRKAPS